MTNTTINTLQTTQLNKTFYDRQLLESARHPLCPRQVWPDAPHPPQ